MKQIKKSLLAIVLTFGILSAAAIAANAQGRQDFVVVNNTGVEIHALYVTPHSSKQWGEDILGVDTLEAGDSLEIVFSPKERAKYWDIRVEDADGNYIEWGKLNLLEISKVTLYYKNGKATAIVE
jgi:hypothetical protein